MEINKILEIYDKLKDKYGKQGWWPLINNQTLSCEYCQSEKKISENQFEISVGAILTQNTQWCPNVVRAIQQLKLLRVLKDEEILLLKQFKKSFVNEKKEKKNRVIFENAQNITPNLILNNSEKTIKNCIRPAGYFNQKYKKLKLFSEFFNKLKNKKPEREELLNLWGIGLETADSILLYAYNKPVFVVDAYTERLLLRSKIINKNFSYDKIQKLIESSIPKDANLYKEFHAFIVEEGKTFKKKQI